MATLMMLGIAAQAQAEGSVNPTREKTGYWAMLFSTYAADSTATSAAVVCEVIGKSMPLFTGWDGMVFVGTSPNATYYAGYEALDCLFRNSVTGVTVIQNAVFPVTRSVCPANSTLDAMGVCICNNNYNPDPTRTRCVPVAICPIPKFPDINDSDACTRSLEKGAGKDVDGVCEPLDPEMVKQEKCLAKKIRDLGISYTEPSATVRTEAYQQHFVNLWEWYKVKIPKAQADWTDAEKQECAPMVAKVNAEWSKHKLKGQPSNSGPDAPHVLRKAVDIDEAIPKLMMEAVTKTTFFVPFPTYCLFCLPAYPVYIGDVQDYVNSPLVNPPACKLRWGGLFKDKYGNPKPDLVHFDLFLK